MLVNKSAWTSEGRTRTARSAASALPLPLPSGFLSLLVYAEHSEHLLRERMVVSTGDNTPCAMNAQNHGKDEQGIDWQSTLDTYLDRFVEIGHSGGMICTAASRENTSCGRRRLPWKRTVAVRGGLGGSAESPAMLPRTGWLWLLVVELLRPKHLPAGMADCALLQT